MRWCEENTLKFVKLYLDKEFLWNTEHEWYKLKSKREIAYSEIMARFKTLTRICMTIPDVKMKIKSLRSTYTQEVQKVLQMSRPDSIYRPSLVWFNEMERSLKFLRNGRKAAADLSHEMQEIHSEQAVCSSLDNSMLASGFEDESSDPLISLPYTDNEYEVETTEEPVIQIKMEQDSSPKYSNIYLQKRKRKKVKKSPQYVIRSKMENWSTEDEFDIYGKYIAAQLRKMELQRALKIQLEIQNLMNKARISTSED